LTRSDISEERVDCGQLTLTIAPRSAAAPAEAADVPAADGMASGANTGLAGQMGRLQRVDARTRVVAILDELDALGLTAQRTRISGEQLVLDGAARVVRVPGEGSLYWYGRGENAFRQAADGGAAPTADTEPVRIISTWRDGMVYHMKTRRADLTGEARVVILGNQSFAGGPTPAAGGRTGKTALLGDVMQLTFKTVEGGPDAAFVPQMGGGGGLKHVLAEGQAYAEYGDLTLTGNQLDYDAAGGMMSIGGDSRTDAQVYRLSPDGRLYDHFTGPRLQVNTRTGELEADRSRLRYHPGAAAATPGLP
jgi:lipopolysaccharide export system protein LptA